VSAGTYNFTITASDANSNSGARSYTIDIVAPTIALTPDMLDDGILGTAYSVTLSASGGVGPYGYSIASGALPAGLTLSGDGLLSGTPTAAGSFSFTVSAVDANGNAGTKAYSIAIVSPQVNVTPATLPDGSVGTAYSQPLSATGGTAPYSYAVSTGTLPAGLTLPAREGTKAVEAARDRAREAKLAFAVGRDRPKKRRAGLMRPMRATQTLDGPIGAPAGLEQEMDALLLVRDVTRRMIGPARSAGVREDQDPLAALHERGGFGLAGPGRPGLQLLPTIAGRDEPLGPPRHLGDIFVAELLQEAIERGGDRWQRTKVFDELRSRGFSLWVVDRVPRLILHGHRTLRARIVGEHPHLPRREGALEIVDHIFTG